MVTLSARVLLYRSSLMKPKKPTILQFFPIGIKQKKIPIICVFLAGRGDLFTKVSNVLCVKFHPVLQLPSDVLIPPLSQVGDDDSRVEGACVGSHPQLLDSLLLEIQETDIGILLKKERLIIYLHQLYIFRLSFSSCM